MKGELRILNNEPLKIVPSGKVLIIFKEKTNNLKEKTDNLKQRMELKQRIAYNNAKRTYKTGEI